jgi:uncharacterized protein YegL
MIDAAFDLHIHTLIQYSPTIGCIRITTPDITPPTKDNMVSLVVLADASGSMDTNDRLDNLRNGILRLGGLSNQFASMNVELTVIQFNDDASIVFGPGPMPTEDKLKELCMSIKPSGGTNIGKAIELALDIAEERTILGKSVHAVLFTDGVDTSSLKTKMENKTAGFQDRISSIKFFTIHCVGICADADATLLDLLVRASRRGTFQCIKDNDITNLISCLWGLMMEMIDTNVRLLVESVDADGVETTIVSRDIILRVCSPSVPLVVGFKVPQATALLRARMVINDRCLETRIDLPRTAGPSFDMVCAEEGVNLVMGELSEKIVVLIRAGNIAAAILEVGTTREVIGKLIDKTETEEQKISLAKVVDNSTKELDATEADLLNSLADFDEARDTELRAMSRCATQRNSGVSIVPGDRTLSSLQRQLSA